MDAGLHVPRLDPLQDALAALDKEADDRVRLVGERGKQAAPFVHERPAAIDHRTHRGAVLLEERVVAGMAKLRGAAQPDLEVRDRRRELRGQVDAVAVEQVAAHVLDVVHHLETRADAVAQLEALGRCQAEDGQHQASHGIGAPRAIVGELVPGGVAVLHLVLLECADQVIERRDGEPAALDGGTQRHHHGMPGLAFEACLQFAAPPRQETQALLAGRAGLVAQVIGPAAERVDGGEVAAHAVRHQRAEHAEVLVVALGKLLAPRTGARLVHGRRHAGADPRRAKLLQLFFHALHGANSSGNGPSRTMRGGKNTRTERLHFPVR